MIAVALFQMMESSILRIHATCETRLSADADAEVEGAASLHDPLGPRPCERLSHCITERRCRRRAFAAGSFGLGGGGPFSQVQTSTNCQSEKVAYFVRV